MLAALVVGLVLGLVVRGRPANLVAIRFRWVPLAVAGLLVQVALFSTPVGGALGDLAPLVYIGSTALVLLVVIRNVPLPAVGVPGLVVVAAGSIANLVAIVANGGFMPTTVDALTAAGTTIGGGFTNSSVPMEPALLMLTDIFAIPAGIPFASVFSVGDVMIALGIVSAIAAGMRHRPDAESSTEPGDESGLRPTPEPGAAATAEEPSPGSLPA